MKSVMKLVLGKFVLIGILCFLSIPNLFNAQIEIPSPSDPPLFINDLANILTQEEKASLEQTFYNYFVYNIYSIRIDLLFFSNKRQFLNY
jgi:hypothetical protein